MTQTDVHPSPPPPSPSPVPHYHEPTGAQPVNLRPPPPAREPAHVTDPTESLRFMFAVGIECSCPVIAGNVRVDQLRDTGHYELWQTDLKLVRELGLRYLRYGPPIYRIFKGKDEYDWSFLDPVMHEMRRLGIVPIIDLC